MKILLISPRLTIQKSDFIGSGIPYWPVDLAVFAAFLKQHDTDISVIDLFGLAPKSLEEKDDFYLQGKSLDSIVNNINITDYDLVIIYAISYMSHNEIIDNVSLFKNICPNIPVAILENSQAVTAYAINLVSRDFFDVGVDALLCGEMYWNWKEVITYLTHMNAVRIPGNVLVKSQPNGFVLKRKVVKHPVYPVPAWEYFPLNEYWSLPYSHGPKTKRFFPILTSRGCPYPCDFCVVPTTNDSRWRGSGADQVVNEMIELRDKFGVCDFQIEDLNPTVKRARWNEICELLIQKKANVNFYIVSGTKAETLDIKKIDLYYRAGCKYISISPESGSSKILKIIGKPFDYQHAINVIRQCSKLGIYTQACMIVGHPDEKESDHKKSCDYLRTLVQAGLDEFAAFIVSPLAGSVLYKNNAINIKFKNSLPSFSPKGRIDWEILAKRRSELIHIFFFEKLKRGPDLWIQGFRALIGMPRTKMENLPRRVLFIYWVLFKYKLTNIFSNKKKKVKEIEVC